MELVSQLSKWPLNLKLFPSLAELKIKIEELEGHVKEKGTFVEKLKTQHENSIKILKQSTQIVVEENNELSEQITELQHKLKSNETYSKSAQNQLVSCIRVLSARGHL